MGTSQISLNLGIDFGTQYTKVCVRDTDRGNSWVVIPGKPEACIEGSLIVSQVGIHPTSGALLAGLTQPEWQYYLKKYPNLIIIDFIKMRLAHLDPGREAKNWYSSKLPTVHGIDLSKAASIETLCAFFLCQVIKRSKDWIYLDSADLLRGVEVDWSANIGVPVEYCDSPALVRFKRVLCLAWHLSMRNLNRVKLSELNKFISTIRSELDTDEMPCFTLPEIAAAVYSYTFSRQARRGTYIFFDIGGGTMEGAAFSFNKEDGADKIDFLSGLVEPVGVNALAKKVAGEKQKLEEKMEYSIVHNGRNIIENIDKISVQYKRNQGRLRQGDCVANRHGVTVRQVKSKLDPKNFNLYATQVLILAQSLIHRQVATVIRTCGQKLTKAEMQDIVVFLGGGGMLSHYYIETIDSTYDAFSLKSTDMPRYRMQTIPVPDDFHMRGLAEEYFHRFSIAYGLSFPDYDVPAGILPTQVPEIAPPPVGPRWIPESAEHDG
ncbi:hypothetical protein PGN35_022335 [Nodosilinea sp. PGN35]|uniref:hypothetical protein n=1 Tax=Nodosilinea sp. PGN35 TaxID=3020489 RepID=UPI00398A631C